MTNSTIRPLLFLLCDVQTAFRNKICNIDSLISSTQRLLDASKIMDIPLLVTEQVPLKLGCTIKELRLPPTAEPPIPKNSFSMLGSPLFMQKYKSVISNHATNHSINAKNPNMEPAIDALERQVRLANGNLNNAIVSNQPSPSTRSRNLFLQKQHHTDNPSKNHNMYSDAAKDNQVYGKLFQGMSDSDKPTDDQGRAIVALFGIESHVCILQTAIDLRLRNDDVFIITDCVSSRSSYEIPVALSYMRSIGCILTTSESFLFSVLQSSEHQKFRDISSLFK